MSGVPHLKQHSENEPCKTSTGRLPLFGWQGHWVSTNIKWDASQAKASTNTTGNFPTLRSPPNFPHASQSLTVVDLHFLRAFFMCCCTCCTARHRLPSSRRGLRLGERGFLEPAEFGLAWSEGRPLSPHGQLVSSGSVSGRTVLSSTARLPPMS